MLHHRDHGRGPPASTGPVLSVTVTLSLGGCPARAALAKLVTLTVTVTVRV